MIREILCAIVHLERHPRATSAPTDSNRVISAIASRLESRKSIAGLGHMPPEALCISMSHSGKSQHQPSFRVKVIRPIRAPQDIRSSSNDLSLVLYGLSLDNPMRKEQMMLAHDA